MGDELKFGEELNEPDEEKTRKKIFDLIVGAAGMTSMLRPDRVPHVKSHGCVNATFTVNKDIRPDLKVGIFAEPGKAYPARIRFSNSSSRRQEDGVKDARGMAIKLLLDDGTDQDFLLSTEKVFFAKTAVEFLKFTDLLTKFEGRQVLENEAKSEKAEGEQGLKRLARLIAASQRPHPPNPLSIPYFSQTPYLYGQRPDGLNRAVKYSAKPTSQQPELGVMGTCEEALRKHLKQADATFAFQVQVQTNPATMPIEDATIPWPEDEANDGSPYVTVATIEIKKGPEGGPDPVFDCERSSFRPWNYLKPHHRPLGVINRMREVYENAARTRLSPKTQNQLTALMTLKEPVDENRAKLKEVMEAHSLANGRTLDRLGFVHSARFLVIGDKFAIITQFDFDFRDYINTFVDELGPLFDQVVVLMQDAPQTPVQEHRDEFFAYLERIRLQPDLFYSSYPNLSVQNILTMKDAWESQHKQGGTK